MILVVLTFFRISSRQVAPKAQQILMSGHVRIIRGSCLSRFPINTILLFHITYRQSNPRSGYFLQPQCRGFLNFSGFGVSMKQGILACNWLIVTESECTLFVSEVDVRTMTALLLRLSLSDSGLRLHRASSNFCSSMIL